MMPKVEDHSFMRETMSSVISTRDLWITALKDRKDKFVKLSTAKSRRIKAFLFFCSEFVSCDSLCCCRWQRCWIFVVLSRISASYFLMLILHLTFADMIWQNEKKVWFICVIVGFWLQRTIEVFRNFSTMDKGNFC